MINEITQDTTTRMSKAMDALQNNLGAVRTGRAHPSLVERIHVDFALNDRLAIFSPNREFRRVFGCLVFRVLRSLR